MVAFGPNQREPPVTQQLPDKIIRLRDLPSYVGLARTQIDTLICRGLFPRPIRLSTRAKGWLASDIAKWQAGRIALRDQQTNGLVPSK